MLPKQVLRKPDGGSRGFGFVTFKDEMSVEKCLVMQHVLGGKTVRARMRCCCRMRTEASTTPSCEHDAEFSLHRELLEVKHHHLARA